jgi:hypothetical protein
MDAFMHFILPITIIMLLLFLCLWLSMKPSRQLKSLRYASIISFLMVFGVLIVSFLVKDEMSGAAGICFTLFLCPGFFLALPIMVILKVPLNLGPCPEEQIFYYTFVFSFIFYTLLIFGIFKLWHRYKKYKEQKNYDWRTRTTG